MSNKNNDLTEDKLAQNPPQKKSIWKITSTGLAWVFSILLLFSGALEFSARFPQTLLLMLIGVVLFPPLSRILKSKLHVNFNWKWKTILIVILFFLIGYFSTDETTDISISNESYDAGDAAVELIELKEKYSEENTPEGYAYYETEYPDIFPNFIYPESWTVDGSDGPVHENDLLELYISENPMSSMEEESSDYFFIYSFIYTAGEDYISEFMEAQKELGYELTGGTMDHQGVGAYHIFRYGVPEDIRWSYEYRDYGIFEHFESDRIVRTEYWPYDALHFDEWMVFRDSLDFSEMELNP